MPYTLLKFLGWGLAFFAIGVLIGWLLRALKARADVAEARRSTVDDDDLERTEHRLADLEAAIAERDELRARLAAEGAAPADDGDQHDDDDDDDDDEDDASSLHSERNDAERADVERAESEGDEGVDDDSDAAVSEDDDSDAGGGDARDGAGDGVRDEALDLDAASTVLGSAVELDDLTTVDGIGPKIAELCAGIGVSTWRELADTEVATLRSMLDDAGSRYKVHDPTTWPEQAALLADGRWAEFAQLVDELSSDR